MSVISLQAGVAAEAVDAGNTIAAQAIERIRAASAQTLRDLRSMVRILRTPGGEDGVPEVLSLTSVPDLVRTARGVGLEATARIDVAVDELSPQVDAAAYRIVQEALTNVVKHARARQVEVTAQVRDDVLHVPVVDDGQGGAGEHSRRSRAGRDGGTGTAPRGDAADPLAPRVHRRSRDACQAGPVIRLVLVDDQELVRTGLRTLAEHDGDITVVGEAADGRAAWARSGSTGPTSS